MLLLNKESIQLLNFSTASNMIYFQLITAVAALTVVIHAMKIPNLIQPAADDLKPFDLQESLFPGLFGIQRFNGQWMSDTELFYQEQNYFYLLDVETKENVLTISTDYLKGLNGASMRLSPNYKYALIVYSQRYLVRVYQKCAIHVIATGQLIHISNASELQLCQWSRAGDVDQLIFVKENNLYLWKNFIEKQLTFNGIPDVIFNGALNMFESVWASPGGDKLAYVEEDNTSVKLYKYHLYGEPGYLGDQYPEPIEVPYSKAGTTNAKWSLKIINLNDTSKPIIQLPAPINRVSVDHRIIDSPWISNDYIVPVWRNRVQDVVSVQMCHALQATCDEIIHMQRPNGWFDLFHGNFFLTCDSDAEFCFWVGDIDNQREVYSINIRGGIRQETFGHAGTVDSFVAYDAGFVIYNAVPLDQPEARHAYYGTRCLSCDVISPEGNNCTHANIRVSRNARFYALECVGPDPVFTGIYNTSSRQEVLKFQYNLEGRANLKNYKPMNTIYKRVRLPSGLDAAVKMLVPIEINIETTTAKYPMIVYVYGGPTLNLVTDIYSIGFENYLVTNRKIIYVSIDARGTRNKGLDMFYAIKHKFGTIEIDDQIFVTKYLQQNYQFIDESRTGVWGASHGGYCSAQMLAQDVDHVFVGAVSVVPVTSWIYYMSLFTDIFMGLPTQESNLQGYINGDLTRRAKDFRGRNLLLIHGTADDNVHYQHSMALSRALQKEEIYFQQMSYPDEDHSLAGTFLHLHLTMMEFWEKHLKL